MLDSPEWRSVNRHATCGFNPLTTIFLKATTEVNMQTVNAQRREAQYTLIRAGLITADARIQSHPLFQKFFGIDSNSTDRTEDESDETKTSPESWVKPKLIQRS
jgi:thymidylate kinase